MVGVMCCSNNSKDGDSAKEILKKTNVPEEWTLAFDKITHDFGTIKESDGDVDVTFRFVNRSEEPLVLNRVNASCGCTTPEWSKEPVAPGETGYIKVTYKTKNRIGRFNKSITVGSNGNPGIVTLIIKGTVIEE